MQNKQSDRSTNSTEEYMNTETRRKYKEEPKKLKNTITEIKNTLEGNNSGLDDTEE